MDVRAGHRHSLGDLRQPPGIQDDHPPGTRLQDALVPELSEHAGDHLAHRPHRVGEPPMGDVGDRPLIGGAHRQVEEVLRHPHRHLLEARAHQAGDRHHRPGANLAGDHPGQLGVLGGERAEALDGDHEQHRVGDRLGAEEVVLPQQGLQTHQVSRAHVPDRHLAPPGRVGEHADHPGPDRSQARGTAGPEDDPAGVETDRRCAGQELLPQAVAHPASQGRRRTHRRPRRLARLSGHSLHRPHSVLGASETHGTGTRSHGLRGYGEWPSQVKSS
jgi:hypothetical protein